MIKFVYFDVGGVVIKDFSATNKWEKLLDEFGIDENLWEEKYGDNIDRGIVPTDSPIDYPKLLEGFVSRFRRNESIWPVLSCVHKTAKIGLLTNMYPAMFNSIKSHGLLPNVQWDIIIDSSVEKIRKPDTKLFELAEKRSHFDKSEILFVENSAKNIEAANNFGWKTFFYDSSDYQKSSADLLNHYLDLQKH